ncbi:MAG: hypothetical protein K2K15_06400, partial [Anaeroplasmataceae bacterium]|nr:hypothetical protein [Anaeroplasmataceae bacterium]
MTKKTFQNKVVSLLPSITIKKYVKENGFTFRDCDLFNIIKEYAEYFDERVNLLNQSLEFITDPQVKKHIKQFIKEEHRNLEYFLHPEPNYVYDVEISKYERYLAPTFDSAKSTIQSYWRCYKKYSEEKKDTTYSISKRRIANRVSAKDIDRIDEIAEVELDYKQKLKRVHVYVYSSSPKIIEEEVISYPPIFKKGAFVRYIPDWKSYQIDDDVHVIKIDNNDDFIYGINSFDNSGEDVACVLMLDSPYVKTRTIDTVDEYGRYPFLMSHDHIDFGRIELVSLDEVPTEVKEDYL